MIGILSYSLALRNADGAGWKNNPEPGMVFGEVIYSEGPRSIF